MNFKDFRTQVLNYSRFEGQDLESKATIFTNQCISEFLNKKEWDNTIYKYTLTRDGSGSYDLESLITNYFHRIFKVIKPASNYSVKQFTRLGYDEYINSRSKSDLWALVNKTLYIEGDSGDIEIFYQSPGTPYPVSAETDEPQILIDYTAILEKMVVVKLLVQVGDNEQAIFENQMLQNMLNDTRRSENRARKRGSISSFGSIRR